MGLDIGQRRYARVDGGCDTAVRAVGRCAQINERCDVSCLSSSCASLDAFLYIRYI